MIIANPIYDIIFKNLMDDLSIAKGFLSCVLRKKIYSLAFLPKDRNGIIPENEGHGRLKIFHLDFVAEIESETGKKKVLIELQKTSAYAYPHRFRSYIGQLYCEDKKKYDQLVREEKLRVEGTDEKPKVIPEPEMIPIIPILIFGFELDPSEPKNQLMIFEQKRKIFNPNNQIEIDGVLVDEEITLTSKLVECLSHDLIIIQIPFIPLNPKTELEIILSIFEQRLLQKDHWYKEYKHHFDNNPFLIAMLHKLELIAHDEKVAIAMQQEEANELMYQNMLAKERAIEEQLIEQTKTILDKDKEIAKEKRKAKEEKRNMILELNKNNVPVSLIALSSKLSENEVKQILND